MCSFGPDLDLDPYPKIQTQTQTQTQSLFLLALVRTHTRLRTYRPTNPRYCKQQLACQAAKPRGCDLCNETRKGNFHNTDKSGNKASTCVTCQFPTCTFCECASKRAVYTNTPSRVGMDWYCDKKKCQQASKEAKARAGPTR